MTSFPEFNLFGLERLRTDLRPVLLTRKLTGFLPELHRTQIANRRVLALGIVEAFDLVERVGPEGAQIVIEQRRNQYSTIVPTHRSDIADQRHKHP